MSDDHICEICHLSFMRHRDRDAWPPRCCAGCPCGVTQPRDPEPEPSTNKMRPATTARDVGDPAR